MAVSSSQMYIISKYWVHRIYATVSQPLNVQIISKNQRNSFLLQTLHFIGLLFFFKEMILGVRILRYRLLAVFCTVMESRGLHSDRPSISITVNTCCEILKNIRNQSKAQAPHPRKQNNVSRNLISLWKLNETLHATNHTVPLLRNYSEDDSYR